MILSTFFFATQASSRCPHHDLATGCGCQLQPPRPDRPRPGAWPEKEEAWDHLLVIHSTGIQCLQDNWFLRSVRKGREGLPTTRLVKHWMMMVCVCVCDLTRSKDSNRGLRAQNEQGCCVLDILDIGAKCDFEI